MLARVYIGCQRSGSARIPRDSAGNSAPVGVPNPKSRSVSNCSSGRRREENLAMAMLLETWMARASVSMPRCGVRVGDPPGLRPVEVIGMSQTPLSPETASVASPVRA